MRYAVANKHSVLPIEGRETITTVDNFTQALKNGTLRLLQQATKFEIHDLMPRSRRRLLNNVRATIQRSRYQPERVLQAGTSPIIVEVPELCSRDR